MERAVRQGREILRPSVDLQGDALRPEDAIRSLDDDPAPLFQGHTVQPHPQPDAIVQSDPNLLPVVHIVIAVVDAAAVSTRFQFFLDDVIQRSPFRHVEPRYPGLPVAVQFDGGIGAIQGTVQATQGCPGGCMAGIEFRQCAFRQDILRTSTRQPEQEIHVMAAFGQEDGSGKVFPGPQPPHERMSHPVGTDGLGMVDAQDAADFSAFHDFLDPLEIGMISHDQAYGNGHARTFRLGQQVIELLLRGGRRLLQQNGIARPDRGRRLPMVQPVRRRDDDAVHLPVNGKEGFRIREARTRRNPVLRGGL